MNRPTVLANRCVRTLSRWVRCRACQEACPRGAIDVREGSAPVRIGEACDGCGFCSTHCAVEAIEWSPGSAAGNDEELWVLCNRSRVGSDEFPGELPALKVPCLHVLGFRFLLVEWVKGRRRLVVVGADCRGCSEDREAGSEEDGVAIANRILQVAGEGCWEVTCGPYPRETARRPRDPGALPVRQEGHVTSRRGFCKALIAGSLRAALGEEPGGPAHGGAGGIPAGFAGALTRIGTRYAGEPRGQSVAAYRLWVAPDTCYGCGACAALCPTGAVAWEEDLEGPASARICVDASRCCGCGVCIDVCDAGSIRMELAPGIRAGEEVRFRETRCARCSRSYWAARDEDRFCPGCRRTVGEGPHVAGGSA